VIHRFEVLTPEIKNNQMIPIVGATIATVTYEERSKAILFGGSCMDLKSDT
jgi:hypothetical protein